MNRRKRIIAAALFMLNGLLAGPSLTAQTVGIGTTTPNSKALLELQSATGGLLLPRFTTGNMTSLNPGVAEEGMVVYQTNGSKGLYIWDGALWYPAGNVVNGSITGAVPRWDGLRYLPSNTFFHTGASLGLGISTPDVQLQIHGTAAINQRIHFTHTGTGTGLLDGMLMGISGSTQDAFVLQNEAQPLWFGTSANERMRIDAAGNVGINTITPAARLDVSGTVKLGTNGSVLNGIMKNTVSIDIPLLAAGAETAQTLTFANAAVGASVYVSPAAALTGIVIAYARVSSAGNVEIKFVNTSAAAVDPAAMNFFITVIQ
jgi:hypothetical protein